MIDLTGNKITFSDNILEVGRPLVDIPDIPVSMINADSKVQWYEELLAAALIKRAEKRAPMISISDHEKLFPYIKHVIDWLRGTDFYNSPASTKYHDACYCGLLNHTLDAYVQLVGLKSVPKFKSVVEDQWWSAVFAVLVHDWCKIGRYESYLKNVKNNETGEWEQIPSFKIKEDNVTRFGHGTQSLILVMQLCSTRLVSLTFDEMAAIRWHMDAWDIGHYDDIDLQKCNEKIPMVRMVQFADQLAITTY